MKKALSLFLSIVLVLGVFLSVPFTGSPFNITAEAASSGTCGDNLTWTLNNSGVMTISGTGAMTNYSYPSYAPWYSSRSDVKEVVINRGVTSIGDLAFYVCDSLTSITIPDSVTSIGDYAFSWCESLTSITIPDSVTSIGADAFYGTAYYNNSSNWENGVLYIGNHLIAAKTSISGSCEIKAGTKTIADRAFYECGSLTSITIPDSVTSIGEDAFYYCTNLTSITIPDSVTSIGNGAFYNCESLTSITIPDSVTRIGDYAFYYCISLTAINVSPSNQYYTSVDGVLFNKDKTNLIQYPGGKTGSSYTIPDSVTSIGDRAFLWCDLTSITIPDSVTSIGFGAFWCCKSLTSITIPDSVTSIGNYAFYGCESLTSITIPDSVTSIGDYAFSYCDSLTSITIPDSVTSIGKDAFYGCESLTTITIPDSVTSIGGYAFSCCDSLTSITIPDSVTSIGWYAFYNCTSLKSVTIGNSVTSIGGSAFYYCNSLSDVYYSGSSEDWSNISIGSSNDPLLNATVHYTFWITDKAATCTVAGSKHKECTVCGKTLETEAIPATGHRYGEFVTISEATCVENGSKYRICGDCGERETQTIPATGHTVVIDSSKAPTCTETGLTEGSHCSVCNAVIIAQDIVPATGHTAVIDSSKTPTCTGTGLTEGSHCSVCNAVIVAQDIVPATGHTASNWIIDKAATCTAAGSKHKECTVCGEILETQAILATGHTVVIDSSKVQTCTETGLTEGSHCSVCNSVIVAQSVIPATGHTASDWIIDKAATCTAAGSRHKECTVCGETVETEAIPATGHTVEIDSSKAPTCTETGLTEGSHCSVCNAVIVAQNIVPATGHTASDWIIDKAATCTVAGSKHKECTVCGETLETEAITATGHTSSDWITDKKATVNAAGSQHKECTECGAVLETAVIPQLKPSNPTLSKAANANGGVTVTWKAVSGADSYRVYRKTSSSGWTCLNSKVTSTSYTDKSAKSGTTYYYTVRAENEAGLSGYNSTGVSVKYLAMPTVTIANASTGVKVSWNKISGASKYYVYRKASGDKSWTQLTNSATGTSYTDTKAKSGTTYYYTVKAVSGSVASEYKSSSALKYLAQPKVSSLSNTNSGITVKWGKITGASGYYVYRKTGSGSWSLIYTAKSGSTVSYTDKSAKAGTTYYYTVRAYSGSVKSTYTSSSAIRRLTTPSLKSVTSEKSGITFKWSKVTGASGYYVYRKTGSGSWQKIATVKSGSTVSYLDKTAKKGTTYTYTVKAYYSSNVSAYNTTGLKIKDKY